MHQRPSAEKYRRANIDTVIIPAPLTGSSDAEPHRYPFRPEGLPEFLKAAGDRRAAPAALKAGIGRGYADRGGTRLPSITVALGNSRCLPTRVLR